MKYGILIRMVRKSDDIHTTLRFTQIKNGNWTNTHRTKRNAARKYRVWSSRGKNNKKEYYQSYNHILVHGTIFTMTIITTVCQYLKYHWKNKTRVCGTMRENHCIPNQLKEKSEIKKERNDILIERWRNSSYIERQVASLHGDNYSWCCHSIYRKGR